MKKKIRRRCKGGCGGITKPGNKYINGHNCKGIKWSKKRKIKLSLAQVQYNPNYEYCDIWKDEEYKDDLRKDYCENANCKNTSKKLCNHHIYLDKKRCAPWEIMTLCNSCHVWLHRALQNGKNKAANPKDFIIINRPGHVSYIHKETRAIITILKMENK